MRCAIDIHQSFLIGLFKIRGERNDWTKREFLSFSLSTWSFKSWHNQQSHGGLINVRIISNRILRKSLLNLHNLWNHHRHWSFPLIKFSVVPTRIRISMNIVLEILFPILYDERTERSSTNVHNVEKLSVNYPIWKFIYALIPMKDHSHVHNVQNPSHN